MSVTVRKTKGQAIDAACGQLRRRLDQNQPDPVRLSLGSEPSLDHDDLSLKRSLTH